MGSIFRYFSFLFLIFPFRLFFFFIFIFSFGGSLDDDWWGVVNPWCKVQGSGLLCRAVSGLLRQSSVLVSVNRFFLSG